MVKDKKKRDKKRKQRRERRGKLPSSVEALLGYLGGGGPGPALQGDSKPKERAGVDAYDTLHQIIKSQQMQNANYMANLERMAFKTEITNQLKQQGEESKKVLEETKAEVAQVRQYTRKSTEEQLEKINNKIAYQMRLKAGANPEKIAKLEADKRRLEGLIVYQSPLQAMPNPQAGIPVAVGIAPAQTSSSVRAGGTVSGGKVSIATAQGTSVLPAIDPNLSLLSSKMGPLSPAPTVSKAKELEGGLGAFQNFDLQVSSGDLPNLVEMSRAERKQARDISKLQNELIRAGVLGGKKK